MKTIMVFALPLAVAAAGCSNESSDSVSAEGGNAVAASNKRSPSSADGKREGAGTPVGTSTARSITLTGFSCGDSCYLEFPDHGESKTALCRASQCSDWADKRALPPTVRGKRAIARFGTGDQVDAAGNIMARDYPTIEELTIPGDNQNRSTKASSDQSSSPSREPADTIATGRAIVPLRFRGLFAVDRKACAQDYRYNPAFQNVTITARSVSFFETGGPVTDVNVEGDRVAITLRETVGDSQFTRAIYLALNRDGTARYRPGKSEPSRTYVRCGV